MKKHVLKQHKNLQKIISEVAEAAGYLWERGWAERNAGNISVNITEIAERILMHPESYPLFPLPDTYPLLKNTFFLVTGAGKRMREVVKAPLKNMLVIKINADGNACHLISTGKHKAPSFEPTSELPTHLAIHQLIKSRGSSEKVVIHAHATELIALSHSPEVRTKDTLNRIISGMHPETLLYLPGGIGFVPFTLPGTVEIAQKTLEEFKRHQVVLWEKHGVLAIGETVSGTFDTIDLAGKAAGIWLMCRQAGFEPEGLTETQLEELKNYYFRTK